jgi:hypothetical protein
LVSSSRARWPHSPVVRTEGPPGAGAGDGATSSTAVIVIGLFICAFIVGLSLRHMKEMNGNFITDFVQNITDKVPTIKVERKEDAGK